MDEKLAEFLVEVEDLSKKYGVDFYHDIPIRTGNVWRVFARIEMEEQDGD